MMKPLYMQLETVMGHVEFGCISSLWSCSRNFFRFHFKIGCIQTWLIVFSEHKLVIGGGDLLLSVGCCGGGGMTECSMIETGRILSKYSGYWKWSRTTHSRGRG